MCVCMYVCVCMCVCMRVCVCVCVCMCSVTVASRLLSDAKNIPSPDEKANVKLIELDVTDSGVCGVCVRERYIYIYI